MLYTTVYMYRVYIYIHMHLYVLYIYRGTHMLWNKETYQYTIIQLHMCMYMYTLPTPQTHLLMSPPCVLTKFLSRCTLRNFTSSSLVLHGGRGGSEVSRKRKRVSLSEPSCEILHMCTIYIHVHVCTCRSAKRE